LSISDPKFRKTHCFLKVNRFRSFVFPVRGDLKLRSVHSISWKPLTGENRKKKLRFSSVNQIIYLKIQFIPRNKHPLGYENRSPNSVHRNNRCLFWESYNTQQSLWADS
jgi:hypothetical protein